MRLEERAHLIKRVYSDWPDRPVPPPGSNDPKPHLLLFYSYLKRERPDLLGYCGCAGHRYERIKAYIEEVDRMQSAP